MNLSRGFQIATPPIFIPWLTDAAGVEKLLGGTAFKKVTAGYYTLDCEPLPGLRCLLGLHLHQTGRFSELEFFRASYENQKASFDEFQKHFETVFGLPTIKKEGSEGFPSYEWRLDGARIVHYVFDRFGPEEHMRIQHV
jgi:hypothetical protein